MQSSLPPQILLRFPESSWHHAPDCKEQSSNFCLYPLRTAFGASCFHFVSLHEVYFLKITSVASRAFHGFVAFTLWLPLTLLGIVLCLCSKSHSAVYNSAKKIFQFPETKEDLGKYLTDISAKPSNFSISQKRDVIKACMEKCANIYFTHTFHDENSYLKMYPIEMKMIKDLIAIFKAVPDDELALYFPHYLKLISKPDGETFKELFQVKTWLPPKRYVPVALATAIKIKEQQLDSWESWTYLLNKLDNHLDYDLDKFIEFFETGNCDLESQNVTKKSVNQDYRAMFQRLPRNLGLSPELLAKCYLATPFAFRIMPAMTIPQIAALTTELKKSFSPDALPFFNLVMGLTYPELPLLPTDEMIERIQTVPRILNQSDPIQWIRKYKEDTDNDEIQSVMDTALSYLLLSKVKPAFLGTVDYDHGISLLDSTASAYIDFHDNAVREDFSTKLVTLAAPNYLRSFSLVHDCFMKFYQQYRARLTKCRWRSFALLSLFNITSDLHTRITSTKDLAAKPALNHALTTRLTKCRSILNKLQSINSPLLKVHESETRRMAAYRDMALSYLQAVLELPTNTPRITQAAFAALLPCIELPSIKIEKIADHIKSKEILHAAVDAAITMVSPINHSSPPNFVAFHLLVCDLRRNRAGLQPMNLQQPYKTIDERCASIEAQLKTALQDSGLLPPLVDIVRDYYFTKETQLAT